MKRADLIALIYDTLSPMFPAPEYKIETYPTTRGNGAYVCVICRHEPGGICNYPTYSQVGYNVRVYAIAGAANVERKLRRRYGWLSS